MTSWILLFALVALFALAVGTGRSAEPPLPRATTANARSPNYAGSRRHANIRLP